MFTKGSSMFCVSNYSLRVSLWNSLRGSLRDSLRDALWVSLTDVYKGVEYV